MTRPAPIKLGPFVGGINTASDPSSVADQELVDCQNLELDIDGSLICRPPIVETTGNSGVTPERLVMIGRAVFAGGITYVIASNSSGTYAFDGTTWTTIRAGLESRVALQYQDLLFVVAVPGSSQNGGYWDGAVWTTDASMPRGEAAVFFKQRLWIVPGIDQTGAGAHQLRYTDPISVSAPTPLVWTGTNLIPVGQGNGQKLIDVVVVNDNLMLFKQDSTYVFAYDILPSEGLLKEINDNIGATTRRCVVTYENSVFVYHEGNVYEILNYTFQLANIKVPFKLDTTEPAASNRVEEVFICLLGDRLIVRYYNRIYVLGLRTKTWSRWQSQSPHLHNFGPLEEFPATPTQSELVKYYAGSSLDTFTTMVVIQDGHDNSIEETDLNQYEIECYVLTKNYDYAESHQFKRLAWWGADVLATGVIQGVATPVITHTPVTWGELTTWGAMLTWGSPTSETLAVVTSLDDPTVAQRKFIKFLKALRFRQINFSVKLKTNGSVDQGPTRLFTLTAIVGVKQVVVKQVS